MGGTARGAAGVRGQGPSQGRTSQAVTRCWYGASSSSWPPEPEPTTWLIAPPPCLPSASGTLALGLLNLTLEGKRLGRWVYSIISPSGSEMATPCFPNTGIRSSILSWEAFGRPTIAHAGIGPSGRCAKEHDAPAAARSAA